MTNAVTIKGVTYPSQKAAAEALGVSRTTIGMARKNGSLDNVGRGPLHKGCEPVKLYKITLGGVHYPSHKAAAEALDLPQTYISAYLKVLEAINNKGTTQ
jgi:hypothetical protein